jgi:hypothetical protein
MAVRAGGSWIPQTMVFAPREQEFTVVQWDQPGTGKTLEATGASITGSMTVERTADDGIEVTEFVRNHLHKDKIVLLFFLGSILGIYMIQKRPDLFPEYVGTGQVSDMPKSQDELCVFARGVAHCDRHEVAAKVGTHRSATVRQYAEDRNIFSNFGEVRMRCRS